MVQEEKITFRRREVRKPAADGASPFRELTRKDQMEFGAPEQKGRAHGRFPTADASRIDSEGKENVGITQNIVIEEIPRPRLKIVCIECPPGERNGDPCFVLLIPLSAQRQESEALLESEVQQRPGDGGEGWRLVIPSVKSAHDPTQSGDPDGRPGPRACGVFGQLPCKVRQPDPTIDRQPGKHSALVFQEQRLHVPREFLTLTQTGKPHLIPGHDSEQRVVLLCKPHEPDPGIVSP